MATKKENEFTIKELWAFGIEWGGYLLKYWKVFLLAGILGGAVGFYYAWKGKKQYTARLTFALEEKSGGLGSYAAIASQFRIDLGGAGSSGAFTGDNLLELMKSRLMIEKTLLTPVLIEGKTELLINRYIAYNKLRETSWANKPYYDDVVFVEGVPRTKYSLKLDSILFAIQQKVVKENLVINRFDKRLNLVYIECTSIDELFAKHFAEVLMYNASSFYIETKTKKSRNNVAILEHKVDSVKQRLDGLLYSSAVSQDQNLNPARARIKVPYMKNQIDVQLLTAVYVELSKNLELSSFALMREEPLVQIIDTPILPLRYEKKSKMMFTLMFGISAGFIVGTFLVIKRILDKEFKKEL